MNWDYSSSRTAVGSVFTATCNTGYAFFRSSGGSFTTYKTKVGTCTVGSSSFNWKYDDGGSSLDDCDGNQHLIIITCFHQFFSCYPWMFESKFCY